MNALILDDSLKSSFFGCLTVCDEQHGNGRNTAVLAYKNQWWHWGAREASESEWSIPKSDWPYLLCHNQSGYETHLGQILSNFQNIAEAGWSFVPDNVVAFFRLEDRFYSKTFVGWGSQHWNKAWSTQQLPIFRLASGTMWRCLHWRHCSVVIFTLVAQHSDLVGVLSVAVCAVSSNVRVSIVRSYGHYGLHLRYLASGDYRFLLWGLH